MVDFLWGLGWIGDIAMLDMRRMSVAKLWANTIWAGVFAAAFIIGPIVALVEAPGWRSAAGAVIVPLFGIAFIARIVQGWLYYFRYTRTGIEPPQQPLDKA